MEKFVVEIELHNHADDSVDVWAKVEFACSIDEARERAESVVREINNSEDELHASVKSVAPMS